MSIYQKAVIDALENKGESLTVREIMKLKGINSTKSTYVISAVKKLIEDNKIRVEYISNSKKTLWMDASIMLLCY